MKSGKRRSRKNSGAPSSSPSPAPAAEGPRPSPSKKWLFRSLALLFPVLLLLVVELLLRLFGIGYPTTFFLEREQEGKIVLIENPRFTWRFFAPELARTPQPVLFHKKKAPGTVRIFVFGESAAMGDPDPAFGLPRVLETLLTARSPQTRFEVINCAVVAINSHAILPIARECARYQGDYWVVYMGNNEVIGPYGSGTIFGKQTPPLPLIRAHLALSNLRLVQWLRQRTARKGAPQEWGGMEMFLGQQVASDNPKLHKTYANFQKNLQEIIKLGRKSGAEIILSTVGSNLRDCAPFASVHSPGLSTDRLKQWQEAYQQGQTHFRQGQFPEALAAFDQASQIDPRFAGLQYLQGRAKIGMKKTTQTPHFVLARDYDALRFRADSQINQLIHRVGENHRVGKRPVHLVDSSKLLDEAATDGIGGSESFYEHVHFTFSGTYRVAWAMTEQILPARAVSDRSTESACAERLGFSPWHQVRIWRDMKGRLSEPPFTHQQNHQEQMTAIDSSIEKIQQSLGANLVPASIELCKKAIALNPIDPVLHENFGRLLGEEGQTRPALEEWLLVLKLWPHSSKAAYEAGNLHYELSQYSQSRSNFLKTLELKPDSVEAMNGLGLVAWAEQQPGEAIAWYQKALRLRPRFHEARVNLGKALAATGRKNEALHEYEFVLKHNSNHLAAHINLGKVLSEQGKPGEALAHYQQAVKFDPTHPVANYNLAKALASQGEHQKAIVHYRQAVQSSPQFLEARLDLALELAQSGQLPEAISEFQEMVRQNPEQIEGRFNLGVALAKSGRMSEAITQFRETVKRQPDHPQAKQFLERAQAMEKTP